MTGIAIDAHAWPCHLGSIVHNRAGQGGTTGGRGSVFVEDTNHRIAMGERIVALGIAVDSVDHALELVRLVERQAIGHDG